MNLAWWVLKPIPIVTESWLIFAVVLITLIVFIWLISRLVTRATEDSDPAEVDRQMLTAINDLHRKGDLSGEEFRSIKGQLVERLHENQRSAATGCWDQPDLTGSIKSTVTTRLSTLVKNQDRTTGSATCAESPTSTEYTDTAERLQEDNSKRSHRLR